MPMKREQQWDMFDVATGACGLDDYLFQRYSENDLMSKFWVEKTDHVDELRKPPEGSASKEQIIVPIQGPRAGTPVAAAEPVSTQPLPSRPSWETGAAPEPLPSRPPWEAPAPAAAAPPPVAPAQPAYTPPPAPPVRPPQPAAPTVEAAAPAAPPWSPPAPTPPAPAVAGPPPVVEPPKPPSMEELLARFHQAAAAYEERAKDELPEDGSTEEPG